MIEANDNDENVLTLDYDTAWKSAIDQFFQYFVEFVLPDVYDAIDWTIEPQFLDTELQKIMPDSTRGRRTVDRLVQVKLLTGAATLFLIHVEVQSQTDALLPERMFVYHYRIFERTGQHPLGVVVLGDNQVSWRANHYINEKFGTGIRLGFRSIKLLDFADQETELQTSTNPIVQVIRTHLLAQQTPVSQRREIKLKLVRNLYRLGFSAENVRYLFRIIDTLIRLRDNENIQFWETIRELEQEAEMELLTTFERVAIERGRTEGLQLGKQEGLQLGKQEGLQLGKQEGLQLGKQEGLQQGLLVLLSTRFGLLPERITQWVRSLTDIERLNVLLMKAITATTLAEFERNLDQTNTQ